MTTTCVVWLQYKFEKGFEIDVLYGFLIGNVCGNFDSP